MRPPDIRFKLLFPLLGVALGTATTHLRADFTLDLAVHAGEEPLLVEVLRQSLEERRSIPLAEARVADGRAHLAVAAAPGLFELRIGGQTLPFVAAGDDALVLTGETSETWQLRGGPAQEGFQAYEAFRRASLARLVYPVRARAREAREQHDDEALGRLTREEVEAYEAHRRELNDWVIEHLTDLPTLYASSLRWSGTHRLDALAAVVSEARRQDPDSEIGTLMDERIGRFIALAPGATAPALSGSDPEGRPIALADLRGGHVLVDFWASWCAPCRLANRGYRDLYQRFHDKGFEILAVSVDQDGNAWRRAIRQDEARWKHLSDLEGWGSPLAARYNVSALPANFLLDPEGRVVAHDLSPDELEAFLENALPARP